MGSNHQKEKRGSWITDKKRNSLFLKGRAHETIQELVENKKRNEDKNGKGNCVIYIRIKTHMLYMKKSEKNR